MNCPKCGYVMSDLDIECPRCKRLEQQGAQPQKPPPASPATPPYQQPYAQRRPSVEYAGFWVRVAASLIDSMVTMAGGFLIGAVVGGLIGGFMGAQGADAEEIEIAAMVLCYPLGIAISWLYSALLESGPQQATLGKMALGIMVTDLDGDRVSFGRATGRFFPKYISALILLAGYLMVAWTEKRQGLHDILAGTLVVTR